MLSVIADEVLTHLVKLRDGLRNGTEKLGTGVMLTAMLAGSEYMIHLATSAPIRFGWLRQFADFIIKAAGGG